MNWYRLLKLAFFWPYGYWILPDGETINVTTMYDHEKEAAERIDADKVLEVGSATLAAHDEGWVRIVMPAQHMPNPNMWIQAYHALTSAQKRAVLGFAKDAEEFVDGIVDIRVDVGASNVMTNVRSAAELARVIG